LCHLSPPMKLRTRITVWKGDLGVGLTGTINDKHYRWRKNDLTQSKQKGVPLNVLQAWIWFKWNRFTWSTTWKAWWTDISTLPKIKIDGRDVKENTSDSILVNRRFDLNQIDEGDSQFERHNEPTRLARLARGVQTASSNSSPGSALPLRVTLWSSFVIRGTGRKGVEIGSLLNVPKLCSRSLIFSGEWNLKGTGLNEWGIMEPLD
jgi:hypothetical protein